MKDTRRKSPLPFVVLAAACFSVGALMYVVMSLAFGAAADDGDMSLAWEMVGFVAFISFLGCIIGTLTGIVGAIVRVVV